MKKLFPIAFIVILGAVLYFGLLQGQKELQDQHQQYQKGVAEQVSDSARYSNIKTNLISIRRAISAFRALKGRYPANLDELVDEGLLDHKPQCPYGAGYDYDPDTGEVKSIRHPEL